MTHRLLAALLVAVGTAGAVAAQDGPAAGSGQCQDELDGLTTDFVTARDRMQAAEEALEACEARSARTEAALQQARAEADALRADRSGQDGAGAAAEEPAARDERLEAADATITQLNADLTAADSRIGTLRADLDRRTDELAALQQARAEDTARIAELVARLEDHTRRAEETAAALAEAQAGQEAARADAEAAQQDLARVRAEVETATRQLQATRDQRQGLAAALDSATADVARLTARLAQFGIAPEAGFSHAADDPFRSHLGLGELDRDVGLARPVTPSECSAALDWLTGGDAATNSLWIADPTAPSGWAICAATGGGRATIRPPRSGEAAHLVVYQ